MPSVLLPQTIFVTRIAASIDFYAPWSRFGRQLLRPDAYYHYAGWTMGQEWRCWIRLQEGEALGQWRLASPLSCIWLLASKLRFSIIDG